MSNKEGRYAIIINAYPPQFSVFGVCYTMREGEI